MTYKSKNAQVMLKDLCMKPGEFFEKKNKSEACSSFNIDLRKVHVNGLKKWKVISSMKCIFGVFFGNMWKMVKIYFKIDWSSSKKMLSNRGSLPTPHYDLRKIRLLIFSFVGQNRPFLEPFKVNSKENGKEMWKKIFFSSISIFWPRHDKNTW